MKSKRPVRGARRSPKTGRFISSAAWARWWRKGARTASRPQAGGTKQVQKKKRRAAPLPPDYPKDSKFRKFLTHPDDAPRGATWYAIFRCTFDEPYPPSKRPRKVKPHVEFIPLKAPEGIDTKTAARAWYESEAIFDFDLTSAGQRALSIEGVGVYPLRGVKSRKEIGKRVFPKKKGAKK